MLRHGDLELDRSGAQARYGNRKRSILTRTEYAILETLLRHPSRVFSATALYERAAGFDGCGSSTSVKSHMTNLRKKLRSAGCLSDFVVTVQGFGYRLADA